MSEVRRRIALFAGCVLLVGTSLWIGGCSKPSSRVTPPPGPTPLTAPMPVVHGPYGRGQVAVVGRLQFELVSWEVCNPEAIRISERFESGPIATSTPATAGRNYVDAAVRVRDLDATQTTSTLEVRPPVLGDPYVMVGTRRFTPVDGQTQENLVKGYFSTLTLVTEYELPKEASAAVLYWPVSKNATQVVAFTLW